MSEAASDAEPVVQSLVRGLAVIRAFGADTPALTLSEVARKTRMSRAAARRFLLTLMELGYVRSDGREFTLSARVLELGYAYLSGQPLPRLAQPVLDDLSASLHESVSMAVLDGTDIVYVARVHTRRIMSVAISVGTRFPAHATSMGRVLLAGLPEGERRAYLAGVQLRPITPATITDPVALEAAIARAAERGWALVDQELEVGLCSIAVPVRNPAGAVVAALNVSLSAGSGIAEDDERVAGIVAGLLAAAERILDIERTLAADPGVLGPARVS